MALSGYDLCIRALKKNKSVAYADVKKAADKKGIVLYPISYGRAKRTLGLVKDKVGAKKPGRPKRTVKPSKNVTIVPASLNGDAGERLKRKLEEFLAMREEIRQLAETL